MRPYDKRQRIKRVFSSIESDLSPNQEPEPWQLLFHLDELDRLEEIGAPKRDVSIHRNRCEKAYSQVFGKRLQQLDGERTSFTGATRRELTYKRCRGCRRLVTLPCVACQCELAIAESQIGGAQ